MKNIILISLIGLLTTACGTANYPDIKYTNNYTADIEFTTVEKDSPVYKLAVGDSITLSSDVPGRAEIKTISEKFAAWEYTNNNVYDIQFIPKTGYKLDVLNFTDIPITISEKNGLLAQQFIEIPASTPLNPGKLDPSTLLYTDQPVFIIVTVPDISFKWKRLGSNFVLGIDPPDGDWWNYNDD
ncbi:MAG: hypothetical protein FWF29_05325 [Treponema sp.]|nr:hypothetical protein [Treponema sp.]